MSIYYVSGIPYSSDELYHHGIKGQKWGVRRFQNTDGTFTEAGKKRYSPSTTVHMPTLDVGSQTGLANSLNGLKTYQSITSEKAEKYSRKHGELQKKQSAMKPNSRRYNKMQDKVLLAEKKYVENRLASIAYLNMIDIVQSEAKSRGYEVIAKQFKNAKKPDDYYFVVAKK